MGDLGGLDRASGANNFANEIENPLPWFKRWYVWVLPGLVLIGVLLFGYR